MKHRQKRWRVPSDIPAEIDHSLAQFPKVLRHILYHRGYTSPQAAQAFLEAEYPPGTDPLNLKDMPRAVERLVSAIKRGENIVIYGDYDADGVTGCALLILVLRWLGAQVRGYIPNRFDEGYGLNFDALNELHAMGAQLIVSVDCGIRSPEEVEFAKSRHMDMILTDHHHPGAILPQAYAVINPKQTNDRYPEKNLAGVGLAYKLAQALLSNPEVHQLARVRLPPVEHFLDLVALGTVADMVPIIGENRSLVRRGLEYLRAPQRQGVFSLIHASGVNPRRLSTEHIGFILAPRLNAAGRLETALDALSLLTTDEVEQAALLAQKLDSQNRERQRLTQEIQQHAEQIALAEDPEALILIAVHPEYNLGVVGLAASRLCETFYRPAIVAQKGEEVTRGSCRSIPEFHITQALDECGDLLMHHGGHQAAAGFTLRNADLPEFIERLKAIAQRELAQQDLVATLTADIELPLSELKPEILRYLELLEPTGQGNPRATFVSRDLKVLNKKAVGKEWQHLKLRLSDGYITYDAIAFRMGALIDSLPERVDVMYHYEVNEYNGQETLQLKIVDIKPTGAADGLPSC